MGELGRKKRRETHRRYDTNGQFLFYKKYMNAPKPLEYPHRQYFQHAHFIPIVGAGKRGAYYLVHGDLPRQYSFGTTLRFTGPVPADSRQ